MSKKSLKPKAKKIYHSPLATNKIVRRQNVFKFDTNLKLTEDKKYMNQ